MTPSEPGTQDSFEAGKAAWESKVAAPVEEQESTPDAAESTTLPTAPEPTDPPAKPDDDAQKPDGSADAAVDGQPAKAPDTNAAAPSKSAQPSAPAPAKPWKPKADGREIDIPGAFMTEEWLAIPVASVPKLMHSMADRTAWQEERKQLQKQIASKGEERSEAETRAQVLVDHFADLLEKGPKAVLEWLNGFEANKPLLERDLELATYKAKDGRRQKQETETQEEATLNAYDEWRPGALKGALDTLLARPEFKDLGLDDEALLDQLGAFGDDMFFRAENDLEAYGQKYKKGEIGIRYERILHAVRAVAKTAEKIKASATATQNAKATNAAAVAPSKAPPAVSAKGSPTPGGKDKKMPASREEWEKSLEPKRA